VSCIKRDLKRTLHRVLRQTRITRILHRVLSTDEALKRTLSSCCLGSVARVLFFTIQFYHSFEWMIWGQSFLFVLVWRNMFVRILSTKCRCGKLWTITKAYLKQTWNFVCVLTHCTCISMTISEWAYSDESKKEMRSPECWVRIRINYLQTPHPVAPAQARILLAHQHVFDLVSRTHMCLHMRSSYFVKTPKGMTRTECTKIFECP